MIVGTQGFYGLPINLTAQAGADVVCNSGAATTALSSGGTTAAFVQPHPGLVVPSLSGVITITLGAAAPTAMVITFATTAGTPIDSFTVSPTVLVNLANLMIPLEFIGAASASVWQGAGLTPLIQVNPTAQNVTVRVSGSRVQFGLISGGA
jgi:hypothetical protein